MYYYYLIKVLKVLKTPNRIIKKLSRYKIFKDCLFANKFKAGCLVTIDKNETKFFA